MKSLYNNNIDIDIPCDSTINGECSKTNTLEECVNKCKPPNCYWGTWSDQTKVCMPMNYNIYRDLNPGFVTKEQQGMTTFIDTNFFEYPAQRNNRIFFYDRVKIQNVETGYILEPRIRLRMTKPSIPQNGLENIPVTTRSPILFYDRNLDSVLRVEGNNVNWYKAIEFLNEDYEAFFLEPMHETKNDPPVIFNEKKYVYYSDTFRIRDVLGNHLSLPHMYKILKPRLNDLIITSDIYTLPNTYRFLYMPAEVQFS